jgi:hypothetical protein
MVRAFAFIVIFFKSRDSKGMVGAINIGLFDDLEVFTSAAAKATHVGVGFSPGTAK